MGETTSAVALQSKNTVDFSLQGIRKTPKAKQMAFGAFSVWMPLSDLFCVEDAAA